jgi:hypothetical protein
MVILGVNDVEDVTQRQRTVRVIDGGELNRGVASRRAHFETHHVLSSSSDDEIAGTRENPNRDLITHHTRRARRPRLPFLRVPRSGPRVRIVGSSL